LAELGSQIAGVYRLAGLRIVSDLPLSGLPIRRDASQEQLPNVVIRRAAIPEGLAAATAMITDGQCIGRYNGREVLIDIPATGRFLVRGGNEILVDPAPSSNDNEIRAYLLGTAFGLLCYQRGITPLHAAAIDFAGGCVAFVGESGAGKSTLAAALARSGHQVISDDLCFQQLDVRGGVWSWPGIGRIRLWEEAMYALGCNGPGVEREIHGYDKYFVPIRPPRNPIESRRLHRVYQLHTASDDATKLTRLRGAAAVEVLMQNTYRLSLAQHLGYKPNAFIFCAAAARDVPVFRFSRPLDFDALSQSIQLLENHLLDMC
jgi:energy-coupling factor transporter ATP-binding protein EcfA2